MTKNNSNGFIIKERKYKINWYHKKSIVDDGDLVVQEGGSPQTFTMENMKKSELLVKRVVQITQKYQKHLFASVTPKQMERLLKINCGLQEIIMSDRKRKIYFDVDRYGGKVSKSSNDTEDKGQFYSQFSNFLKDLEKIFPDPQFNISGYDDKKKKNGEYYFYYSRHVCINNYFFDNLEETKALENWVKLKQEEFPFTDDCVYGSNRAMKCVNQAKPNACIQKILKGSPNPIDHIITIVDESISKNAFEYISEYAQKQNSKQNKNKSKANNEENIKNWEKIKDNIKKIQHNIPNSYKKLEKYVVKNLLINPFFAKTRKTLDKEINELMANFDHSKSTGYYRWLRIGMALHFEYEGQQNGLLIFCKYYKENGNGTFNYEECCKLWAYLKINPGNPITIGTLRNFFKEDNPGKKLPTFYEKSDFFETTKKNKKKIKKDEMPVLTNLFGFEFRSKKKEYIFENDYIKKVKFITKKNNTVIIERSTHPMLKISIREPDPNNRDTIPRKNDKSDEDKSNDKSDNDESDGDKSNDKSDNDKSNDKSSGDKQNKNKKTKSEDFGNIEDHDKFTPYIWINRKKSDVSHYAQIFSIPRVTKEMLEKLYIYCFGSITYELPIPDGFGNIFDKARLPKNVTKMDISSQDIDINIFNKIKDKQTIYLKSCEGTSKTGAILSYINKSINKYGRVIICNNNISTLAGIYKRLISEYPQLKKHTVYYAGAKIQKIRNAKILICSVNSITKIYEKPQRMDTIVKFGEIKNLENTLLFIDEASVLLGYFLSSTLKNKRESVETIDKLIKYSKKAIFADADLSPELLKIISSRRRNKKGILIRNTYQNTNERQRNYNIINNEQQQLKKIRECWKAGEKIYIFTDSLRNTERLHQRFINDKWDFTKKTMDLLNIKNKQLNVSYATKNENITDKLYDSEKDQESFLSLSSSSSCSLESEELDIINPDDHIKTLMEYDVFSNSSKSETESCSDEYTYSYGSESDSKSNTKEAEIDLKKELEKEYPTAKYDIDSGIFVVNSKQNNDPKILGNISEFIQKYKVEVMISSPSISVGTNIDCTHFDRCFGMLYGNLIATTAQQCANRVRSFKQKDAYIFIDRQCQSYVPSRGQIVEDIKNHTINHQVNKSITDYQKYEGIDRIGKKDKKYYIAEFDVKSKKINKKNNEVMFVAKNTLMNSAIFHQQVTKIESNNNFMNLVLQNMLERGHTVTIHDIIEDKPKNKPFVRKTRTALDNIELAKKGKEILESDSIYKISKIHQELEKRNKKNKLTRKQQMKLEKFYFYKNHAIKYSADKNDVFGYFKFVYNENYPQKIHNIKRYFSLFDPEINNDETKCQNIDNKYNYNYNNGLLELFTKEQFDVITVLLRTFFDYQHILHVGNIIYLPNEIIQIQQDKIKKFDEIFNYDKSDEFGMQKAIIHKLNIMFRNINIQCRIRPNNFTYVRLARTLSSIMYTFFGINISTKRVTNQNKKMYECLLSAEIFFMTLIEIKLKNTQYKQYTNNINKFIQGFGFEENIFIH